MARRKKKEEAKAVQTHATAPQAGAPVYPYPVAPPAAPFVQLPPIVQPIVMVPFASQQQPMALVDDDFDDDFDF